LDTLEQAEMADLIHFLPPAEHELRGAVLLELIMTHLEIAWRRGRAILLERFVEEFPELGTVATLPPRLIYAEFWARCRYGDKPALENYRDRFPDQYESLQQLATAEMGHGIDTRP
jgi:hypothetical protein